MINGWLLLDSISTALSLWHLAGNGYREAFDATPFTHSHTSTPTTFKPLRTRTPQHTNKQHISYLSSPHRQEDHSITRLVHSTTMAEQRIVFYGASFFKIDGVTLTLRGLISHITNERGGQVLVLTADNPSDSDIHDFTRSYGGHVSVMRVAGGPVPAPGADYALGLRVPEAVKEALEAYCPTAVHITNPDLVALWVSGWVVLAVELQMDVGYLAYCSCTAWLGRSTRSGPK